MSDPFDLTAFESEPTPARQSSGYLDDLNDAQRTAVETVDGPVLVLAGAGTGKTRVLTTRLAHILQTGRAFPGETLTVTFTNKAAREMKLRVEQLIGRSVEGWHLGTFHSIGARMLRRHAELVGLKSNFAIIDTDDQVRLIKQVMADAELDEKRWPARVLAGIISRWKDRALAPDQVAGADGTEFANGRAVSLYAAYQERLQALNAADFGDLLLHNLTAFAKDAAVLATYQDRFKFILVDEYQDTNVAQYLWLRLLAQKHRNICCVGDDDQSIYAWRGAEVGNILRFEKDFPGAEIIRLECNYRSTKHILATASGLIAKNEGRLGKTLWTNADGGEKLTLRAVWDSEDEARSVGDTIESLHGNGHRLNEVAVLVRASHQTRAFEERFIKIGLPYRVVGGLRFYERLEIRDAVAYLRVIAHPDDDLAFERIVNKPKRGLGNASVQTLNLLARRSGLSLCAAAQELCESDELRGRARTALSGLIDKFEQWRTLAQTMPLSDLAARVLDESGYLDMWKADKAVEAPGRVENLKELVTALEEFDDLDDFLEHVSLVMDTADALPDDMVNIMTLHSAKGLEFDTVFLPGWEEGLFPHQRALDEGGAKALEEERRLAYVGLTRARHRIEIVYASNRELYGRWISSLPSRFLDELPDDHIERVSELGAYSAALSEPGLPAADSFERPDFGGRRSNWSRYAQSRFANKLPDVIQTVEHAPGTFEIGMRVFHQKFGYGLINAVDGNKLDIAFDKAGDKKVMDSFVSPA